MTTVLVPVRFPISPHSTDTLRSAVDIARAEGGELIVMHVDLYQDRSGVTRDDLKHAVEAEISSIPPVRYNIVRGFLVEETILEEIASQGVDVVVIGHKQASRWRQAFSRLLDDPDIAAYLEEHVDCEVVVVPSE